MDQRFAPLRGVGPASDVDHPRQVALPIDQEDRPHAVAEPVKPLDRRQAGVEGRCTRQVLVGRGGRIVLGAEQEAPGRDSAVLVGRQRGHPQGLERRGDPVGADRIEIVGDDQVFGLVLEPIEAMRELLVEQPAKPEVDRLDDHLDHVALRRQERRRVARLKREMGPQPLDLDAQAVGIVVEPVIRLIAEPSQSMMLRSPETSSCASGKEVLERAPEHHLVHADDPGNRPAGTLASSSTMR